MTLMVLMDVRSFPRAESQRVLTFVDLDVVGKVASGTAACHVWNLIVYAI